MATTVPQPDTANLQELAKRHLWLHFSRMGAYDRGADVPIIVKGDGCYVWDDHGNRYLDALSALFCVNIGHGRADIAQAGADQAKELGFFTTWSYAHPRAIELAAKIAVARPGRPEPRLLHLRRRRVRRDRAQGRAPVPQAHRQPAQDEGHRAQRRLPRHDARSAERDRRHRAAPPFEPFTPGGCHVPNTNMYRLAPGVRHGEPRRGDRRADRVRGPGDRRRRDPRAGPERRRLLHAARGLLPARARDLRPLRRAVHLRRGDLLVGPPRRPGSARSATTTSRTSSRPPRASRPPTRRWAR